MQLIINGFPCCGKSSFGDWLRDQHGYFHFDLEQNNGNGLHPFIEKVILKTLGEDQISWIGTRANKIVVTWGFSPIEPCFNIIKLFQKYGFQPWWFSTLR